MARTCAALVISSVLCGCAAQQPLSPQMAAQLEAPVCDSAAVCTAMWQSAQVWVIRNSTWKIQLANDTVIQTFGPGDSTDVAYTVTKEPLGGEQYRIAMRAACGNLFGCVPKSPRERIIEFNNAMRAVAAR